MIDISSEGWAWLYNSRKWHFFRNKQSLCGKFMLLGHPIDGYEIDRDSPSDCAECKRRRAKENTAGKAVEKHGIRANERA